MNGPLDSSPIALFSTQSSDAAGPPRTVRAAREFEASLVAALLASLEKTFAAVPGESGLPGADDYNYLGTHALAEGIVAHGGFGIATLICRALQTHEGNRPDVMKPLDAESVAVPKVRPTAADRRR